MKEIPDGFKKMDLVLTFKKELITIWENKILHMLVRDFYIFYTKVQKFDGKTFTELHFYCRPQDEVSIAYRIGCYAQTLFKFHKQHDFDYPGHSVPKGFPDAIHIDIRESQLSNIKNPLNY